MISARDYTEIMICKRLNTRLSTDRPVKDEDFWSTKQRLSRLIEFMAHDNKIKGFDPEDLEGFFDMKIHQCLRRGVVFDNEFSYYAKSFESLVRDIEKMLERCKKRTYHDPLEEAEFWTERNLVF